MENIAKKIILELAKNNPDSNKDIDAIRRLVMRADKESGQIPKKSELLKVYHELVKNRKIKPIIGLEKLLIKRSVRTLSGVAIVTVLTKPFPCPGQCIYCPSELQMPKSYLSDEPAAARALALHFDPYEQVVQRLKSLEANGHPTDKVELIVKGGTWNAYPLDYQYWFVGRCYEAANNCHPDRDPHFAGRVEGSLKVRTIRDFSTALRSARNDKMTVGAARNDIIKLQHRNETAKHRIIGLTLETRPDFINETTINQMRGLGCTRVELGVQTIDDKILKLIKRGHDSGAVRQATKLLKNNGFKVDYHLMPQLPGSTPAKDLKMMREIFSNPAYRPDMIKIYPCTVIKNSELFDWFKKGKYKPYPQQALINLLKKFKIQVPRYARISRLIRDIPGNHVEAGNKVTNLRQVVQAEMAREGLKCRCLRCREVGHVKVESLKSKVESPKLFIDKYEASSGTEYFLSFEDKKRQVVFAFCRLRIPLLVRGGEGESSQQAFLRELHTYGQLVNIGKNTKDASQHTGLGKKLLAEAEKICRKNKIKKLTVIAGVGVRGYYRRMGYKLEKTYMVKKIIK